ncbi:MAG: peptidoglycan DD-metalloendopeptidase family protein [Dermabacter sp.]|nr:peptidoglycan DD-metalloendopeptidase family protein [Dermabacter sp.]
MTSSTSAPLAISAAALLLASGLWPLAPSDEARAGEVAAAIAGTAGAAVRATEEAASPLPPITSRTALWQWPVEGAPELHARFEAPSHRYGPGHRGIDISGSGPNISAVEAGTVHFAGVVAGKPVVSIAHADGLISTYEPVVADVATGDEVGRGQRIGTLQADSPHAHCREVCLHIGAKRGGDYIDPLPLFGVRGPSVLYPHS